MADTIINKMRAENLRAKATRIVKLSADARRDQPNQAMRILIATFEILARTALGIATGALLAEDASRSMARRLVGVGAKWCDGGDIAYLKSSGVLTFETGAHAPIGEWTPKVGRGRMIHLREGTGILCLGGGAEARRNGFTIPLIARSDRMSIVATSASGAPHKATSGHRARIGHVFQINWDAVDDEAAGIVHPRFNPLSPKVVPTEEQAREIYFDGVAEILLPRNPSSGDNHLMDKGRAALAGFIHMIHARVGEARDYEGIPIAWSGKEPSLGMLVDTLTDGRYRADQSADHGYEEPLDGTWRPDPADPAADHVGDWIGRLVGTLDCHAKGHSRRGVMELAPLVRMAPAERSAVLGVVDRALAPFKGTAAMQRTSATDLEPRHLHGVFDQELERRTRLHEKDPERIDPKGKEIRTMLGDAANWRPVTVYAEGGNDEAGTGGSLTRLLVHGMLTGIAMVQDRRRWRADTVADEIGPLDVTFALEDFTRIGPIPRIVDALATCRAKGVTIWMNADDLSDVEAAYGTRRTKDILDVVGCHLVMYAREPRTVAHVVARAGMRSVAAGGTPTLTAAELGRIPPRLHVALLGRGAILPIKVTTPYWFLDDSLADRVHVPERGTGPKPSAPIGPGFGRDLAREKTLKAFAMMELTSLVEWAQGSFLVDDDNNDTEIAKGRGQDEHDASDEN